MLGLCAQVCKLFQESNQFVYHINDIIPLLIKNLQDAYLQQKMYGQYFLEFEKLMDEIKAGNHGEYRLHDIAFHNFRNKEEQDFLERKMKTVMRGLANSIIEHLKKYFPESDFIKQTRIFDIEKFIKNTKPTDATYPIGLKEIFYFCEFYGESKKFGAKYAQPLIHSEKVKDQWPYFKLMLLHNFDREKLSENLIGDVYKFYKEDFKELLELMKNNIANSSQLSML